MKISSLRTSGVAAVAGIALASTLLFGASTVVANAQSVSLSQLVQLFISLGIIDSAHAAAAEAAVANMGTTASTASSYTYTRSLTVGSTGADVTALQNAVGISPATGFFGPLTQAAVAKWQASVGLPSTGFFGPLSIAKINASAMTTTTTTTTTSTNTSASAPIAGCVSGAMFSSTTGASCATTSTPVTNTGVEGILTVNLDSVPSSGQNVFAGDTQDSLIGIKLQAQLSPITIQRVQLDLGNSTSFYTKYFTTLYLVSDTGQTLAQATLNGNTVTKQTSGATNTYYLNFSGFNYTVPGDNSIHVLTVKGDVYGSIDSDLDGTQVTIGLDSNSIRGVDGAGVDQYGPTGNGQNILTNSVIINQSLSDSASLQLSTDPSNPLASQQVAASGANSNELDGRTALIFDLYAQKDWVQLDSLIANFGGTGTGLASATTAYLYAGSNQISSAAISYNGTGHNGTASFTNVNYQVPQNATQAFTIKTDIKNANTTTATWYASVTSADITAENSQGDTVVATGSATGNNITVSSGGPVFSLVGTPSFTGTSGTIQNNSATSTATATFNVNVQAIGSNVYFGDQTASSTFAFGVYVNGVETAEHVASSSSVVLPSSGLISEVGTAFELQQNNSVVVQATFAFSGRDITSGVALSPTNSYAVGIDSIKWSPDGTLASQKTSSFMTGQTAWRTGTTISNFP